MARVVALLRMVTPASAPASFSHSNTAPAGVVSARTTPAGITPVGVTPALDCLSISRSHWRPSMGPSRAQFVEAKRMGGRAALEAAAPISQGALLFRSLVQRLRLRQRHCMQQTVNEQHDE